MSNSIKIEARLRLAKKSDLFLNPIEYLKPNVVYFVASSDKKKFWSGVTTHEKYGSMLHHDLTEAFIYEQVYVLSNDNQVDAVVALSLELAEPKDLKSSYLGVTGLRENFQYYVLENKEEVLGPFKLSSNTNLDLVKYQLDNKLLYIVNTRNYINMISINKNFELHQKQNYK